MVEKIQSTTIAASQQHQVQDHIDHSSIEAYAELKAKERDENGPWTLWSPSEEQKKNSSLAAPQQNDNNRLSEILVTYGNNAFKWPALIMALNYQDYEAALFLLEHGANCKEGISVIHRAYYPIDVIFIPSWELRHEKTIEKERGHISSTHNRPWIKATSDHIPEDKKEIVKKIIIKILESGALNWATSPASRNIYSVLEQIRRNKWYDIFDRMATPLTFGSGNREKWNNLIETLICDSDEQAIEILDKNYKNYHHAEFPNTDARLMLAIKENNLKMVKYFINKGANVNYGLGTPREMPLALASKLGNKAIIDLLLSTGARLG